MVLTAIRAIDKDVSEREIGEVGYLYARRNQALIEGTSDKHCPLMRSCAPGVGQISHHMVLHATQTTHLTACEAYPKLLARSVPKR